MDEISKQDSDATPQGAHPIPAGDAPKAAASHCCGGMGAGTAPAAGTEKAHDHCCGGGGHGRSAPRAGVYFCPMCEGVEQDGPG